ncbi:MAG: thioredoxin-dependent thiol peroxidase [Barnesiella sp.]|nr:thioredoxin-dependent thiol peroxidase [Bacteroidales bacterium]MBD5251147.1 thioredoxin-dependent thiol peroxidase [Barnesiella sp.]MBD5253641.1 thioredoxin-dependent thiol peroxidase [Barnesiella sp.]MBD5344315.1 thioredoxin-dependent thiol peroxidase [Bacteroides sp.]
MEIGQKLPEVLGTDADGKIVTTDDFEGRPLIVYFYPKDNTPGCTAEACSIRDEYAQLREKGYVIIGISKDSPASHEKFASKHSLPFLLLSDESTAVNQEFGVWQKKKMAGREYMGTVRTTFITDADHKVVAVIDKVNTKAAGRQLLDVIEAL